MKVTDLKAVATPCIDDHVISAEKFETKGVLSSVCTRIVLNVLYFARITRSDSLASVDMLARDVTRWTAACDDRLKTRGMLCNHVSLSLVAICPRLIAHAAVHGLCVLLRALCTLCAHSVPWPSCAHIMFM